MQYSEMLLSDGNKLKPKLESQLHRFRPTYFKDYTDKDHGVHLVCIDDVDFYTDAVSYTHLTLPTICSV